jgi:hypothetical protein
MSAHLDVLAYLRLEPLAGWAHHAISDGDVENDWVCRAGRSIRLLRVVSTA